MHTHQPQHIHASPVCDKCSPPVHSSIYTAAHISEHGRIFLGTHRCCMCTQNTIEWQRRRNNTLTRISRFKWCFRCCQLLSVEVDCAPAKIQLCLVVTSNRTHFGCGFRISIIFPFWRLNIQFDFPFLNRIQKQNQFLKSRKFRTILEFEA